MHDIFYKMRSMLKILLVLSFGLSLIHFNAIGQDIPQITAEEVPGYDIGRNECFDGGSLWGYMNGGADIYLEYGFEVLRVEEFSAESENIKLELYKMHDPLSAFGIYSIKTFKCIQSRVLSGMDCLNRYQYQLIRGNYYMQFISESGSQKAMDEMMRLASILMKKTEAGALQLPALYLTDSLGFSASEIKMLKGRLGVQDKASLLGDGLKGISPFQLYIAQRSTDGKKHKYYEIVFGTPALKQAFMARSADAGLRIIAEDDEQVLLLHEK